MKSKSGFTIIELLVVLVVVSILLGITAFAYSKQQAESRSERRIIDAYTLMTEMDAYYQKHGNFPVTCDMPGVNPVSLRTCTGSNSASSFYTGNGMMVPGLLSVNPSPSALQAVFPSINKSWRDPSSSGSSPQINDWSGSAFRATSYFLFSADLIYNGVGETGTIQFLKPSGGTLTCRYNLEAASTPQASLPHQYIIGVPNEMTGSWSFFKSSTTLDRLDTNWGPNSGSDAACTPFSIDDL